MDHFQWIHVYIKMCIYIYIYIHTISCFQDKPLGVMYELRVFVAERADEKQHKRNSVTLAVRKVSDLDHDAPIVTSSKYTNI